MLIVWLGGFSLFQPKVIYIEICAGVCVCVSV